MADRRDLLGADVGDVHADSALVQALYQPPRVTAGMMLACSIVSSLEYDRLNQISNLDRWLKLYFQLPKLKDDSFSDLTGAFGCSDWEDFQIFHKGVKTDHTFKDIFNVLLDLIKLFGFQGEDFQIVNQGSKTGITFKDLFEMLGEPAKNIGNDDPCSKLKSLESVCKKLEDAITDTQQMRMISTCERSVDTLNDMLCKEEDKK